jgi:IS5 family transposase
MLKPLDDTRRDGPLYPGSTKTLRDFIDPKHLLKVDANFDFEALVEFIGDKYDPAIGRPAIHPEVLVRALLLDAIYDIGSYRQLCERITENLAWRYFCHLALEDKVFDHSTITVFVERLGAASFQELLKRLNIELVRLSLLSPRTYVDSSLVEASSSKKGLEPSDLSPEQFKQQATEKDGVFTVLEKKFADPDEGKPASFQYLRYQDGEGRLPLSRVDPDARWRKPNDHQPAILGYKENLIVDKSGFILAREVTRADASDLVGIEPLLERLPVEPRSFAADTGYRSGRLRQLLRRRGITPYIPLHPNQEASSNAAMATGEFTFHGDHLSCRQGKILKPDFPDAKEIVHYVARQSECQACSVREACLAPKETRKHVAVSRYELELRKARELNQTEPFRREMRRRKTIVEGVFARLDRLDWDKARLRGLVKVDCQASIAALAHNILKALSKVRFWRRQFSVTHAPDRSRTDSALRRPFHLPSAPTVSSFSLPALNPSVDRAFFNSPVQL